MGASSLMLCACFPGVMGNALHLSVHGICVSVYCPDPISSATCRGLGLAFLSCKFRNFSRGFYFREASHVRNFVKMKSSRNG